MDRESLELFRKLEKENTPFFNLNILHEIVCHDATLSNEELLRVANVVREVYLEDESDTTLGLIVAAILDNWKEIKGSGKSYKEILKDYIY